MSAAARHRFLAELFAGLKAKSFAELAAMPERSAVKAPAVFKNWKFAVLLTRISPKKIEVTLQARFDYPEGDASMSNYTFRMSSNGRIQEDAFVDPED